MNKRYYNNDSTVISRLADQAHETSCSIYDERLKKERADAVIFYDIFNQKFAELIVRECADTIENRTPGQMGKEGEGWTNGYDDGLKTSAFLIKKHFGVEE